VGAFNLSLILRKLLGAGTPRELKDRAGQVFSRLFFFLTDPEGGHLANLASFAWRPLAQGTIAAPQYHRITALEFSILLPRAARASGQGT